MDETPTLHRYCPADRAEVFDLFRQSFQPELADLKISQFQWKYEANPFAPSEGPKINILRLGPKLVGLSSGFHLQMWMAGIECLGEGRGDWIVHPAYRGRNLWRGTRTYHKGDPPVRFGWSQLPDRVTRRTGYFSDAVRPLVRILNVGTLLQRFTYSRIFGSIVSAGRDALPGASGFGAGGQSSAVVRLEAFDDRVDRLWERARRRDRAMVVRASFPYWQGGTEIFVSGLRLVEVRETASL